MISNSEKSITAKDLVQKNLLFCAKSTTIYQAAMKIREKNTSSILIKDNEEVVGIWTEADSTKLNFNAAHYYNSPIHQFMSSPVITINEKMPLQEIIMAFHRHRVRHLLVENSEKLTLGIISQSDVIKKQGVEHYLRLRKIKDNYNPKIPIILGNQTISAVTDAMSEYKSTSALIRHHQTHEFGIITERDLLRLVTDKDNNSDAWSASAHPLITINEEDTLYQAYLCLQEHKIRHLIVQNSQKNVVGVLSLQHILSDIEIAYFQKLESVLIERDNALEQSKRNLVFAEKIIESSLDSIMVTNGKSIILSVNAAFTRLTGYSEEEVIGKSSNILSSGKHDKNFYQKMWQSLLEENTWQGEIWNKKKSGDLYPEWLTIVQINENNTEEPLYAAIFSDITQRKLAEKRIHALAFYDELTGLPNRRLFNDRFEVALSTAHRNKQLVAVLFLDLDRFKQINDSLGHNIGDEILIATAKRIKNSIEEGDTVSRFGGDEFIILLTEMASLKDIVAAIERIVNVLSEPHELDTLELQITCSIGASVYPEDGVGADILLKQADTAMYKAKDEGRNSYQLYSPEMNIISMERLITQNFLRSALKKNEFELYYQLQVNSITQKVVGIEALLRWNHPDLGRVSPAHFIPMAEELGLIVEIDRWVLTQACKQRKIWQQQHFDCGRIAINISSQHFKHNLVESIKFALQKSALSPSLLEIEVTENCFIENIKHASATLQQIRQLGIKNSIDDFGTGFSSLSYLTQLPFDTLKIDASFTSKLPDDLKQCQIVKSIIAMAKGLDLTLVGEGVETVRQAEFLTVNGCDVIQGYLYSIPENAQRIAERLLEYQLITSD
jgi:diguanylate cyclase (GGDEF)-like protein/PAS domain S-box-containing protein